MPHPTNPDTVYGSCKGQFSRMSLRTGQEKNYWIGAQSLYGNAGEDLIYRFQRVSPMETSPYDPRVVYYGSQYVHRTRDKGVHVGEDLARPHGERSGCCQGVSRRADHARHHGRRVLHHAVRDHANRRSSAA